jgi:DnaK suppressor protein
MTTRRQAVKSKPGKVTVSSKTKSVGAKSKPAKKVVNAKPATKPAAKALKKPAAKSAKPAVKAKPVVKPAAKTKPKLAPAKVKAPVKSSKPVSKSVKPGVKTPVKTVKAKTVKVKAAGSQKSVPTPAEATAAPVATVVQAGSIARAGRPSSRLAQLTVPSMAQSVASTAAKASYLQASTAPVIASPVPMAVKKDPKLANNWKTKTAEELSDEELVAMPDSEYMNEKQLASFRHKLMQLKADILSNAGETTEHLREETVVVPDPADRATIEEEHALELRTRDRERKLLKKIEQSIARIDTGDYGFCDETGEPIGVGRLLARPTATLSLEAQQRRELKQKMFGD